MIHCSRRQAELILSSASAMVVGGEIETGEGEAAYLVLVVWRMECATATSIIDRNKSKGGVYICM
jgi:hypothetical protein